MVAFIIWTHDPDSTRSSTQQTKTAASTEAESRVMQAALLTQGNKTAQSVHKVQQAQGVEGVTCWVLGGTENVTCCLDRS